MTTTTRKRCLAGGQKRESRASRVRRWTRWARRCLRVSCPPNWSLRAAHTLWSSFWSVS